MLDQSIGEHQKVTQIEHSKKIITFSNFSEYIKLFKNSPEYKKALLNFMKGKSVEEEYPGEIKNKFEEMEDARRALIEFAQNGKLIEHKPDPKREKTDLDHYLEMLSDYKRHPSHFESAVAYDKIRAEYHNKATSYIMDKYKTTRSIAVGITQIVAIEKGLESFGFASLNRIRQLEKTL